MPRQLPMLNAGLLLLMGVVIAWQVVHVNSNLYGPNGRPRLPNIAVESPGTGSGRALPEADRQALVKVLNGNPAEVAAALLLARDRDAAGDAERAAAAYALSARLAPGNRDVLLDQAAFLLRRGEVATALTQVTSLLDLYPDSYQPLFPVLAQLLATQQGAAAWKLVAARNPGWLNAFLVNRCDAGADPAMLAAVQRQRPAGTRMLPAAADCLVRRLRESGKWHDAYQLWLNSLPQERLREVGYLFNGGFEHAADTSGFDWTFASQPAGESGHTVEFDRRTGPRSDRALAVTYAGKRQMGVPVQQYLNLQSGRYLLRGMVRTEGIKAGEGVAWRLQCAAAGPAPAELLVSPPFAGTTDWQPFSVDFAVPAQCTGQHLQLVPVAKVNGISFVTGKVWFDDLEIRSQQVVN